MNIIVNHGQNIDMKNYKLIIYSHISVSVADIFNLYSSVEKLLPVVCKTSNWKQTSYYQFKK